MADGGWGNPLNRDVRRVRTDAVDDYVSIERARDVYGVVIDPVTFEMDQEATELVRNQIRCQKESGEAVGRGEGFRHEARPTE